MIDITPISETQKKEEDTVSVFLAGSIEMGSAINWQKEVIAQFTDTRVTFYNPRRDEWDTSWEQDEANPHFNHQVNWELNSLNKSDIIFMYLDPETKSPISLLELGMYCTSGKMIVCCPDGFWRRGNVEIVCTRNRVPLYRTIAEALGALRTMISIMGDRR